MKRLIALILAVVLFVAGILILVIGGINNSKMSEETTGTIVGNRAVETYDEDTGYSTSYYPVYEYEVRGETYTKDSSVGYGKIKYEEGEKVTVKYNPEDPEKSTIKGESGIGFLGISFMVFGLVVAFLVVKAKR